MRLWTNSPFGTWMDYLEFETTRITVMAAAMSKFEFEVVHLNSKLAR